MPAVISRQLWRSAIKYKRLLFGCGVVIALLFGWQSTQKMLGVPMGAVELSSARYASDGAVTSRIPGSTIRENLREDLIYATMAPVGGWNNAVMGSFSWLHAVQLLRIHPTHPINYVPIMMPFLPHLGHLEADYAPPLPFGDVFDTLRLSDSLGTPIVELRELKTIREDEEEMYEDEIVVDELSCWTSSAAGFDNEHPGHDIFTHYYDFKVSWTPFPLQVVWPIIYFPRMIVFSKLVDFLLPVSRKSNKLLDSFLSGGSAAMPPLVDDKGKVMGPMKTFPFGPKVAGWREPEGGKAGDIMCFNDFYYSSTDGNYPFSNMNELEVGPWATIGRIARWNPDLEQIAWDSIRETISHAKDKPMPTLITVHIRRTDFLPICENTFEECFSVRQYLAHVEDVKEKLRVEKGALGPYAVVATTDEEDLKYRADLLAGGIHLIDHHKLRTIDRYGIWYPTLIDAVVLSLGQGFVGTAASTMTILADRRILEWNNGTSVRVEMNESPYKKNS